MKIALVVEWMDPWRGGAETSTRQFLRHIVDLGVEVEVYTRSRCASAPGMTVHTVRSLAPTQWQGSAGFPRAAAAALQDGECDLVHAIVPCPVADIYQPRGGTVAEVIQRNLALRHSPLARQFKSLVNRFAAKQRSRLRLERRLLERSPRPVVVAISDYVCHQLATHYAFPETHTRRIFNGVDLDTADSQQRRADRIEVRKLHGIRDRETLALMVAHNFRLKGIRRWIETLARLERGDKLPLRSLVVGKENPARWQKLAARMGVGDRIQFAGPTGRIQAYYHAADFLVHPTYYDPCSRVVLESLASRLPCLTTRFDGASDVIQDDVNGYVVDSPDDIQALVDRTRALADAGIRRRLAERTRECLPRISMRRHAQEMLQLYENLIRNGGPT